MRSLQRKCWLEGLFWIAHGLEVGSISLRMVWTDSQNSWKTLRHATMQTSSSSATCPFLTEIRTLLHGGSRGSTNVYSCPTWEISAFPEKGNPMKISILTMTPTRTLIQTNSPTTQTLKSKRTSIVE